ncbi:MAG TPA: GFA family protein [Polyangiaceae bacterium]|nr:GFA family protein [Polyangiaceae bacterium]
MKQTYQGSCHCGAIRFECDVDLSAGTMRCNCSFCAKNRLWLVFAKKADFRLLAGENELGDYQHTPAGKTEPFLHLHFCRRCGVRPFSRGGSLPQFEGEFCAISVACLDDVSDSVLAATPVHFADGRHDRWDVSPEEHRHL